MTSFLGRSIAMMTLQLFFTTDLHVDHGSNITNWIASLQSRFHRTSALIGMLRCSVIKLKN